MSVRSILALGLLAAPMVAGRPGQDWNQKEHTVTVTKTVTATVSHCPSSSQSTTAQPVSIASSASTTSVIYTSAPTATSASVSASSASSSASASASSSASSNTLPSTTLTATHTGTSGLNDYAKATGKVYMGTAADIPNIDNQPNGGEAGDQYYLAELKNSHDFGALTPANIMKWEFIEPEQNVFNFTGGDEFVALAKSSGQLVRCHNLNWYNQNPTWLTNPTVPWTNATITAALVNHINQTVAHFGDDCYAWDVVNEAFNDDGTYREDIWYNTTGTSYIYAAFAAAQAVVEEKKLNVKLYYNDYNIEYPGVKATAAQNLVASIKARGIRIDGVGLQSHFIVGETPSTASQVQNMQAFAALNVSVAVTELDVRTTVPPTLNAEEQQVLDYASTVAACNQVKACVGVTVWDFDDTYSWIPSTFAGQGYGDLFFQPKGADTPLVRKAAYDGVIDGWTGVVPTLGSA